MTKAEARRLLHLNPTFPFDERDALHGLGLLEAYKEVEGVRIESVAVGTVNGISVEIAVCDTDNVEFGYTCELKVMLRPYELRDVLAAIRGLPDRSVVDEE